MAAIHRRQLLLGSTALVAAAASGLGPAQASLPAETLAWTRTEIPVPSWAVGTEGEWDWDVVRAWSRESARVEWARRQVGGKCRHALRTASTEYGSGERCECHLCRVIDTTTANRKKSWDGREVVAGDNNWFRAGMGALCDECGAEVFDSDARIRGGRIVCYDCTDEDEADFAEDAAARTEWRERLSTRMAEDSAA